jgi:hypothetical protein
MTPTEPDREMREEIAKAFDLTDLCSTDPKNVDAALDAAKAPAWSRDKIDRILKKAAGALPVGERPPPADVAEDDDPPAWSEAAATEDEKQLAYMCRNEGGEMPKDVEDKLARLREQAKRMPAEGNSGG